MLCGGNVRKFYFNKVIKKNIEIIYGTYYNLEEKIMMEAGLKEITDNEKISRRY